MLDHRGFFRIQDAVELPQRLVSRRADDVLLAQVSDQGCAMHLFERESPQCEDLSFSAACIRDRAHACFMVRVP